MEPQFYLYQSNQLYVLKEMILAVMQDEPLTEVFATEKIIVQSHGMEQWLNIEQAKRLDIVANVEYQFIGKAVWSFYHAILPEIPEKNLLTIEMMTWIFMMILADHLQDEELKSIQHQLDLSDQKQWFQFANAIAKLFDQYLVYRPDWLKKWQMHQSVNDLEKEKDQIWQTHLWCLFVQKCKALHLKTRLEVHFEALEMLKNSSKSDLSKNSNFPKRVLIFGAGSIPILFFDFLYEVSRFIPVYFFHMTPTNDYLQDTTKYNVNNKEMNPLLIHWGAVARDFEKKILEYPAIKKESLMFSLPTKVPTLLNQIQSLVVKNERNAEKQEIDANDVSIQFANCYGVLREVEALHDYLLHQFNQNPDLTLNECVVMTPDIDKYAPYIEAVFKNAPQDRFLPYDISDRKYARLDPLINGFFLLLDLPNQPIDLPYLFDVLSLSPILAHFGLSESNLAVIKDWFLDSGTNWGLNETASYSLDSGIERMLLGYMMSSDQQLWHELAAYEQVQGQNALIIGKMAHFIQSLKEWKHKLAQPCSIYDWQTRLNALIEAFFEFDSESTKSQTKLQQTLTKCAEEIQKTHFDLDLEQAVIQKMLEKRVGDEYISNRFLIGKINFCTLMPMRNVPFKLVAILGLNEGEYPRQFDFPSYNLMAKYPRSSDRSRQKDDRYLFLEAILSAEQWLYLSYVGRDIQNDEPRYPSILIEDLMDFIQNGFKIAIDESQDLIAHLTQTQPRMPYDEAQFMGEKRSFAKEWLPEKMEEDPYSFLAPLPKMTITQIDLSDLVAFFKNSIKFFLRQRLNFYYETDEQELPDSECFDLNSLAQYKIKAAQLKACLARQNKTQEANWLIHSNQLPQELFGALTYEALAEQTQLIYQKACEHALDFDFESLHGSALIETKYGAIMLNATCENGFDSMLFECTVSNLSYKKKLEFALTYMALQACGKALCGGILIGKEGQEWNFDMDKEQAIASLKIAIELYIQGLNEPLFLPLDVFKAPADQKALSKKSNKEDEDPIQKELQTMQTKFINGDLMRVYYDFGYQLIYPDSFVLPFDRDLMNRKQQLDRILEFGNAI